VVVSVGSHYNDDALVGARLGADFESLAAQPEVAEVFRRQQERAARRNRRSDPRRRRLARRRRATTMSSALRDDGGNGGTDGGDAHYDAHDDDGEDNGLVIALRVLEVAPTHWATALGLYEVPYSE
jgi:hypothetical protein